MNITQIQTATLTAEQAGKYLAVAAQAATEGKDQQDKGKAKGATAQAVMIAGFSHDDVAMRDWTFDILASDGTVHEHVRTVGARDFGNTDLAWCRSGDGKVSRIAQTAYKTGLQHTYFNLSKPVPAVWTCASKAIPIAAAIRAEGMIATIANGELKLEGGDTDRAKAMREAKNLTALAKAAAGDAGANREAPQNGRGGGEGEGEGGATAHPMTPAEILRAALGYLNAVNAGDEALNNGEAALVQGLAKVAVAIAKAEAAAEKAEKAEAARKAARNV